MNNAFLPTVDQLKGVTATRLLDYLIQNYRYGNDRQLALALGYAPCQLCKLRAGHLKINPGLILRVHDLTGIPVSAIRAIARGA